MIIPASIAEVDTPDEGNSLINADDLLVMRPEQHAGFRVVWVTENLTLE